VQSIIGRRWMWALALVLAGSLVAIFVIRARSEQSTAIEHTVLGESVTEPASNEADVPLPLALRSADQVPRANEQSLIAPAPATRVSSIPEEYLRRFGAPDLAQRYDALVASANAGDVEAARELGLDLLTCHQHFERLARHARVANDVAVWPTEEARRSAEDRALQYLESSESHQAMCADVSPSQVETWQTWIGRAAARGDLASAILFFNSAATERNLAALARNPEALIRFRNDASSYLHSAARRCFPVAMGQLGGSYREGLVTPVDPARGYGYTIAARWASGRSDPDTLDAVIRPTLTQTQFDQAVDFANRVYASHCR